MKNKQHLLLPLFLVFCTFSFGQMKTDTIQMTDGPADKLTAKEFRKEKDSVAKNLVPVSDKAIVYIIRNKMGDWYTPYRMDLDSFQMGWVKIGTYLYTILDPGEHVFICTPPGSAERRLSVKLEEGNIYFLEITFGIGIVSTKVVLKMMDEEKGRKALLACNISNHNQYPLFPKSKEVENFPPEEK